MIFQRYVIKSILQGMALTLFVLICISAFLTFVRQLGDIGTNDYGFYQALQYVLLKIPGQVVFSLPIAAFIGSILSLGTLASNNEIVVMQASGMSVRKLVLIVLKAALVISVLSVVMQQWVIPETEARASQWRSAAKSGVTEFKNDKSVWLKEKNNIIYVKHLDVQGNAKSIQVFELNDDRYLVKMLRAASAEAVDEGWLLHDVEESTINNEEIVTRDLASLLYPGEISVRLLKSMGLAPVEMSLTDLYQYQYFLGANGLENEAEKIMFWRRAYSPITILITCVLAIPFVLGSQRGGQTGQRIMLGLMIGLSFVAVDRLVVRISQYFGVMAEISTLIPSLLFLLLTLFLMYRATSLKTS